MIYAEVAIAADIFRPLNLHHVIVTIVGAAAQSQGLHHKARPAAVVMIYSGHALEV